MKYLLDVTRDGFIYQSEDFLNEIDDCIGMLEKGDVDSCGKLLSVIREHVAISIGNEKKSPYNVESPRLRH